jgi:putative salt-induced outer membrane protein
MKKILSIALLAALSSSAFAQWKGVGEFGLAITGGNTDTQNVNGKLGLVNENDAWKHEFGIGILRSEVSDLRTANRFDIGWTSGYKLSETSYVFGSLRYENDDFGPYDSQAVAALGYGFYPIKTEDTTLLLEAGVGYKDSKPQSFGVGVIGGLPVIIRTVGPSDGEAIFRGKVDFSTKLTETTQLYNTFLIEAGSDNKFMQNDLGIAVKISDAFAVKTGFQLRRNSDVAPGLRKTDRLFTTNLVYSF